MSTEQSAPESAPSVESRIAALFSPAPEAAAGKTEQEPTVLVEAPEETQQPPELASEAPPEDDGSEEFDADGVTYRLPKELKAKVEAWKAGQLRQDDYTRKTQEVAALQKQVSVIAETAHAKQQFDQHIAPEREEMAQIESTLKQYKALDWNSLAMEEHFKYRTQMETLKERAAELKATIGTKEGQYREWSEGQRKALIENGNKFLSQSIKGWGPEAMKQVAGAAKDVGYTSDEIENVFDVRFVRLAHKAAQYDKLMSGKEAALATAQKAPPVVKPGASTGQAAASAERYKATRQALRKSGSVDDAARLIQLMSK